LKCENTSCPYWKEENNLVPPEGPEDAKVVLIGEGAGDTENKMGRPFIGRSGQLLRRELENLRMDPASFLITNTVWCQPPGNEDPTPEAQDACTHFYIKEWEKIFSKNRIFVLAGKVATELFYPHKKARRGKICRVNNNIFMSIHHPSFILRNELETFNFREDLLVLKGIIENVDLGPLPAQQYLVVENLEQMNFMERDIQKSSVISLDIETNGTDPYAEGAKIMLLSFSTDNMNYVVPLELVRRGEIRFPDQYLDGLKRVLLSETEKEGHNGKFDLYWIREHLGIIVKNYTFDTMLAQYLLNSRDFEYIGLKHLVWMYRPEYGGYEEAIDIENVEGYFETPEKRSDIYAYAAMDALMSRVIAHEQREQLVLENLYPIFKKVMADLSTTMTEVQYNGFKVDLDYVQVKFDEAVIREKELTDKIIADLPLSEKKKTTFNLGSPKQLGELLFKKMKLESVKTTKKGADSVDVEVLTALAEQGNQFCTDLLELRKIGKIRGTYLSNFLEMGGRDKGNLIRCDYNLGTRGGRLSSEKPNMQNIPKPTRDCFVSRFPGGVLLEGDFKQVELRVCAIYSKDPTMLAMINSGVDLHRAIAVEKKRRVEKLEVKPEDITYDERKRGKVINFSLIYGRVAESLAQEFKIPLEEAQAFHQAFFDLFPMVKVFHQRCIDTYKQTGYIYSMLGRRRFLGMYDEGDAIRRAMNFPIQSVASDICLDTINKIQRFLWDANLESRIVATVHDSIVLDTPEDETELVAQTILNLVDASANLFDEPLPTKFEIELAVGKRWGSLEEV